MANVLRSPPLAGKNIGEWVKQQARRKSALEAEVKELPEFRAKLVGAQDRKELSGRHGRRAGSIGDWKRSRRY